MRVTRARAPFLDSLRSFLLMAAVRGTSAGSRTLFVHAGLEASHLDDFESVAAANALARNMLGTRHDVFIPDSSLISTRSLTAPDSIDMCDVFLPRALAHFDVDRIIVGHTPQPTSSVGSRCGGRY